MCLNAHSLGLGSRLGQCADLYWPGYGKPALKQDRFVPVRLGWHREQERRREGREGSLQSGLGPGGGGNDLGDLGYA